ncbi:hypothetical protein E2C01_011765 [Portunus trituberculatus]|uniref:Uncharacterized protein n=1 Tax=Portunus trituberculatus TaxID=210409 RepID=A0A5B7DBW4_PORTR|nr:hypothetical protein [Portunus trituberculatus]
MTENPHRHTFKKKAKICGLQELGTVPLLPYLLALRRPTPAPSVALRPASCVSTRNTFPSRTRVQLYDEDDDE